MKILAIVITLSTMLFAASNYDRSEWVVKSKWTKARAKVLLRDAVGDHWVCKYSGKTFNESRGLDIDHIIPIKYAFDNGGDTFSIAKKKQFATDDSNLVAVSAHENRSKGDAGLSGYMPIVNTCFYVRRWKYVSTKYKLHIPRKDSLIMAKTLKTCKDG